MNDQPLSAANFSGASPGDAMSALFANLVLQQTNMAFMMLGKIPHPETGQTIQDTEAARMLIDQLEMLECKTKGNLDKREERLLQDSLTAVRLAFVEVVDAQPAGGVPGSAPEAAPPAPAQSATTHPGSAAEEESRKKFTKKY